MGSTPIRGDDCNGRAILRWHAGSSEAPRTSVLVEPFKANDLGLDTGWLGEFWPFASVIETFAGRDEKLRRSFQETFRRHLRGEPAATGLHPGAPAVCDPTVQLYTYRSPLEYDQEGFLDWFRRSTGRNDFLEPRSRRWNGYRGNVASPLVERASAIDDDLLARTYGSGAVIAPGGITLLGDNLHNPYRWIGPINEVHHHEQHALCVVLPAHPAQIDATTQTLARFHKGDRSRRILLSYELDVEVVDRRGEMGEWSAFDLYDTGSPADSAGLFGTTHRAADRYSSGESSFGHTLPSIARKNVRRYLTTRFIPIDVQVAIMVNFRQSSPSYRLAEFMVASKNQQPMTHPPTHDDPEGGLPTSNDLYNRFVVDGGNSGHVAWHRVPVSLLGRDEFVAMEPELAPLVDGGEYLEIPDGGLPTHRFSGTIDITNYYEMGRRHGFFPGQRGYWGTRWVGFDGDAAEFRNPDEEHGIHWIGVLFENHGPFRVTLDVRSLDVVFA